MSFNKTTVLAQQNVLYNGLHLKICSVLWLKKVKPAQLLNTLTKIDIVITFHYLNFSTGRLLDGVSLSYWYLKQCINTC